MDCCIVVGYFVLVLVLFGHAVPINFYGFNMFFSYFAIVFDVFQPLVTLNSVPYCQVTPKGIKLRGSRMTQLYEIMTILT